MEKCQFIEECSFFKEETISQMPNLIDRFQKEYCHGNFSECARYRISAGLGLTYVPNLMMPTQLEWAELIFKEERPVRPTRRTCQSS